MAEYEKQRNVAYANRLDQACRDPGNQCPGYGRLTWLKNELKREGVEVSLESVRRWFSGDSRPRESNSDTIAKILRVDAAWLFIGLQAGVSAKEAKVRNAEADGAVNVIAGLIAMDGGRPAFPLEDDPRANGAHIDLYAVIKGANYSLHVSNGHRTEDGWSFGVPTTDDGVVVVGLARDGFNFRVFEMTSAVEDLKAGRRHPKTITLTDEQIEATKIESFDRRF